MNKIKNDNIQTKYTILYGASYFLLLLVWALMQPFDACPDEAMRYVIPNYIFENLSLPNANDMSIIDPRYGFSYASQPMLPYILSSLFMKIISFFSSGEMALYMAARFTSILSGVGFLFFVVKIAKLIFKDVKFQIAFIALCSLWPQNIFIFTYVNCDGLAMFAVSMMIYCWIYVIKNKGFNFKISLLLSVGMSIALLSYKNVYVFVLLSFIFYLLYYFVIDSRGKEKYYDFFKFGFFILGVVCLLSAWQFIRNIILYGNLFATNINNYGNMYAAEGYSIAERSALAREMLSTIKGNLMWVVYSFGSFIGYFGYMDYRLSIIQYLFYGLLSLIGIISICIVIFKNKKKFTKTSVIMFLVFCLSIIIPIGMSYFYSFSDFQPQGRYFLDILIPLCILLVCGLEKTYNYIIKKYNNKIVKHLWVIIPMGSVLSALWCLYIIYDLANL